MTVYVAGVANESGTVNGPLSLQQSKKIKALLKKYFLGSGMVTFNRGHSYCSAFVRRGDKVVYMSVLDYRADAYQRFYVRTAKDEKDYTGGTNHWGYGFDTIPIRMNELLNGTY